MKIVIGVTVGVVVLIAGIVGAVAVFGPEAVGGGDGFGTAVQLQEAKLGELIETVSAPGQVEPVTNVAISARVAARISQVPFEAGDHVTKGNPHADPPVPPSVLVRLDDTDLKAQLKSAQARRNGQLQQIEVEKARITGQEESLKGTRATLDEARRDLDRQRELVATGDVSRSAYEQAQRRFDETAAQYASAEAALEAARRSLDVLRYNLEAAEAEIERAEDNLSYTTITSPIDGVVTVVNVEPGEIAITGTMNNPGTVLLEVADLSTMVVVAELDEADVGRVRQGQPARVRMLAYPDRVFDGEVRSVALSATRQATKYFQTEVLIQTQGEQLYTGLTADAQIEVARHENVLTVPSQAVLGRNVEDLPADIRNNNDLIDNDKTIIAVVYRFIDGKAVVTPVKIGPSDVTHTVILEGLDPGEKVVVGPFKVLESLRHDQVLKNENPKKPSGDAKKQDTSDPPDAAPPQSDAAPAVSP